MSPHPHQQSCLLTVVLLPDVTQYFIHRPDYWWLWASSHTPAVYSVSSFEKLLSVCRSSNFVLDICTVKWQNSLCMLEVNPLADMWLVNVFAVLLGCFFIWLLFFTFRELLNVMWFICLYSSQNMKLSRLLPETCLLLFIEKERETSYEE